MEVTVYEDNFDEKGNLIIDRYIDFFIKNIQNRIQLDEGKTHLEGELAGRRFLQSFDIGPFSDKNFEKWANDKNLDKLHNILTDSGMELCPVNFYTLCQYILAIIKEQYLILLKPTITDTLEELSEIESITFKTKEGKSVTTNNTNIIKMVSDSIHTLPSEQYEKDKVIKIDEITNNIVIQSSFVYYLADFLGKYFKDYPRRSNCCMVSAKEQDLILYLLYYFDLAPVPLTNSRFRQLISYYKSHRSKISLLKNREGEIIPVQFIKYKDWKKGTIDFDNIEELKEGETVSL